MPRKCAICANGYLDEVNKALQKGMGFRAISRQIADNDSMRGTIASHADKCLKLEMQAIIKANKVKGAINVHDEFKEQLEFAKDLRIASKKYLADPDTDEIVLVPRAAEVTIVYDDHQDRKANGEPKQKRATLEYLLEKIQGIADPVQIIIKHVDLRSFALDAIKTCDLTIDKFAKLGGLYQQDRPNESEQWKSAVQALTAAGVPLDEAITNLKTVNFPPPNEKVESEVISEIGTIG